MEQTKKIAKYSIVPSFFKDTIEIEASDLVASVNNLTKETFINFIGVDGRYYKLKDQYLGMLIINEPNADELSDFSRLKKEADSKEKPNRNIEDKRIYG